MGIIVNLFSVIVLLLIAELICFATGCLLKYFLYKNRHHRSHKFGHRLIIGIVHILDWFRLPKIMLFTVILLSFIGVARAVSSANTGTYIYIQTETATQKDVDVLFEEEPARVNPAVEKTDQQDMLNIPKRFLGADVSLDMVRYFEARLEPIYKQGHETLYSKIVLSENTVYEVWDNKYIEETIGYRDKYKNNPSLGVHYQYGRALTDAGMTFDSAPFSHKLAIMADSISALEALTVYAEWNANTEDNPVLINVCLLAFMNGKLFLHNAPLAAGSQEGLEYVNCFYVEAYVCFKLGKEQSDIDNRLYALMCYYIGDAGENLLARINKAEEPTLYNQVYTTTLANYKEAQELFAARSDFYKQEPRIKVRIENGITTLEGLETPAT